MTITDNLDEALRELEAALDPEPLAQETLERTGEAVVRYDSETVSGSMHRGRWHTRTGELAGSYDYEVTAGVLIETNEAEHAPYVHHREGYSVFTAFDSGEVFRLLQEAFEPASGRL